MSNSLPISIQVMKKSRIENERFCNKRQKARENCKKLMKKYSCGLSELIEKNLKENEKLTVYNSFLLLGYKKESASLLVYGNTYKCNL